MDGADLRQARLDLGLTIEEIAVALKVSTRSMQRFESGERPVPGSVAMLLNLLRDVPEVRVYLGLAGGDCRKP